MSDTAAQAVRLLAGRYEVGPVIGHGGMADVHVGTDARLGRRVAIKLLKSALATDPSFRVRFRQEAQAAARMAHPTIVRVFDAGEETVVDSNGYELQVPFIVMEYVEGKLLKDLIAEGPLSPERATHVIDGVLTALEYSHRAGVVHRDIKPGNIMITPNNQVKVMDFGIARAISDSAATVAQTTAILGTASYFSPEQARGETVDARSDLYSTGVVLFEMLTGRPPFRGDTPVAVAYQHLSEQPIAPSAVNPASPRPLDGVVLRALQKERAERYQSAAEFRAEALAAAAGTAPAPAVTPRTSSFDQALFGMVPTAEAAREAAVRQLTVDEDDRVVRTQSRPPAAWIWAAVVTVVVIVAAVVFWVANLTPPNIQAESVEIPDVVGQEWSAAEALLVDSQLTPRRYSEASDTVPEGRVTRTSPSAASGDRVEPGFEIDVWVSLGAPRVNVPAVAGRARDDAVEELEEAGFVVADTSRENSPSVPRGDVVRVVPIDGAIEDGELPRGSEVELVLSTGLVTVPDVRGLSSAQANSQLSALQLTVEISFDTSCSGGTISAQSVAPGDRPQRSNVTIWMCAG